MRNYLIRIGKNTRKGILQTLAEKAVNVADEVTKKNLYDYFCNRYEGFDININEIETVNLSNEEVKPTPFPKAATPNGRQGSLSFKVKYNEKEKALFDAYCSHVKESDKLLTKLHDAIEDRYKELSYVRFQDGYFCMNLDTNTYEGTYCKSLPISSKDFFNVVKECVEGYETEKLEITPDEDDDLDESDIPF